MKKNTIALAALLAGCASAFAGAPVGSVAYMSSSSGEPWGSSSNIDAMNAAFGAGNWDHISFSDGFSGYAFVYVDGSDTGGTEFQAFVGAQQVELQDYVGWGGRLFLNAATNGLYGQGYGVGFGATTIEGAGGGYSSTGTLTAAGAPLAAHGAGSSWTGSWFAHNAIGSSMPALIVGDAGEAALVGGAWGDGYVMIGGQTATGFHGSSSGNPFQLRVNELRFAAGVAAVPEPETYALMLAGLGTLALLARRRRAD